MRLHDHVARGRLTLTEAGISALEAGFDAELLARHVLGWDRATFVANRLDAAPPAFGEEYAALIARRARREPTAFIVRRREFWGLELEVTPDVLIPRPETELIVEAALEIFGADRRPSAIVDVGTGSGCLAIALAMEFPDAQVVATDVSAGALDVARRNAARHGVNRTIRFVRTGFLSGLRLTADLIVSNPPYIPAGYAPGLTPEVRDHEPQVALYAGPRGTECLDELLGEADGHLAADGRMIVEFGYGQEDDVRRLVDAHRLRVLTIREDLQGIARTAVIARQSSHRRVRLQPD